jgi:biopolymer transport protein ExbD
MRRSYLTIILTIILIGLSIFRFRQRSVRSAPHGIRVALVHNCSNEEALRELGDDRQVIVESHPDGSMSINGTPFSASSVGPELAKIFEYRSLKLVWFLADPQLTYGRAVENLSDLHATTSNFVIALPTTSQIATANMFESQCPPGL